MYDSHCHPQFTQYDNDREEVLARASEAGIGMICVGTDLETSQQAVELAEKHEGMWASVGLHPTDIGNDKFPISNFQKYILHPKTVAIGEVGLDYYRVKDEKLRINQQDVFNEFIQLSLSNDFKRPLILHCREAYDDMLNIIGNEKLNGVIHSFTSNWETAQKFLDRGFYLGFNGIITFPPSRKAMEGQAHDQLQETVINTPLDRILLETDAPFLAPVPHRGKRNEPLWVKYIAEKIAELKNISIEEVANQTTENCQNLFKLR